MTQIFFKLKGYTAKSSHKAEKGGGANFLCLPKDPQWPVGVTSGFQSRTYIYGTEYEKESSPLMASYLDNQDVPCSVCERENTIEKIMIPAKKTCPSGWNFEYTGFLMSGAYFHTASEFICVDSAFETLEGGQSDDVPAANLIIVETRCGALKCPPYQEGYEIICVVCTK